MSIIIDLIAVVIIAIFLAVGIKKGAVRSIFELVGWIIALYLAIKLSGFVADYIYNSFVKENVVNSIADVLNKNVNSSIAEKTKLITESLEQNFAFIIKDIHIEGLLTVPNATNNDIAVLIESNVVAPILVNLIRVIVAIIIYIILMIVIKIIVSTMDLVSKLPVIKQANKLLGGIVGFLKGAIVVYLVVTAIILIKPSQPKINGESVFSSQNIQGSYICSLVEENNFFINDKEK